MALRAVLGEMSSVLLASQRVEPTAAQQQHDHPRSVRAGDVTMRLSCVGLLRYRLFIKAYVAALYLGDSAANGAVLTDVPKRLELSYFWSISGADFGKAGDQILAQNVDAKTFAALRSRLDRINALYRDVKPGDRYSLTYIPGVGTELALNGQSARCHRRGRLRRGILSDLARRPCHRRPAARSTPGVSAPGRGRRACRPPGGTRSTLGTHAWPKSAIARRPDRDADPLGVAAP